MTSLEDLKIEGQLIRSYRVKKKLSQTKLAVAVGVSRSAIANIESGLRNKDSLLKFKVLEFLGYSVKSFNKRVSDAKVYYLNKKYSSSESHSDISEYVNRILKKKKISHDALAKKINVSRAKITSIILGNRNDEKTFLLILNTIGIKSRNELFKVIELDKALEPAPASYDDLLGWEWMELVDTKIPQNRYTINNIALRKEILKDFGYAGLNELNKLIAIYIKYSQKNYSYNVTRLVLLGKEVKLSGETLTKKSLHKFKFQRRLNIGPQSIEGMKEISKLNYSYKVSSERYFKIFHSIFLLFLFKELKKSKKSNISEKTLKEYVFKIVTSLTENETKYFDEILNSNNIADNPDHKKLKGQDRIDTITSAQREYCSERIDWAIRYSKKYPLKLRNNFEKFLNLKIKN